MIRKDFLLKQIEEMARVLSTLFMEMIGKKNQGQAAIGIDLADKTLQKELDLKVNDIIDLPVELFIQNLEKNPVMNDVNLDHLANILFLIAENTEEDEKSKKILVKCLIIYEYLEKISLTYSLDRQYYIERIKVLLQNEDAFNLG